MQVPFRTAVVAVVLAFTSGCGGEPAEEASAEDTGAFAAEQQSCEEATEGQESVPLSPVEESAPELDAVLTSVVDDEGQPCIQVSVGSVPDGWQVDAVQLRAKAELADGSIDSRAFSASDLSEDPRALDRWLLSPKKGCADVSAQLSLRNADDQSEQYAAEGVAGTC